LTGSQPDVYSLSRARGWDWHEVLDLSVSINPLGPPAGVRAAVEAALDRIHVYPQQEPHDTEDLLARRWGLAPGSVLLGHGATELHYFMARAGWTGPAAVAVPTATEIQRAFPRALKVRAADPESWPQRGLLVLTQPNNPTGEALPVEVLRRAIAMRDGPVLLDESFIEFTGLESAVAWVADHANLIVLRSLSKFYALPGLRVGALITGAQWMDRLRRRREPWAIGALAEAALTVVLDDDVYPARSRALVEQEREWLAAELRELPSIDLSQGTANFLFARLDRPAAEVCEWFLDNRKILLKNCTGRPGVEGEAVRFAIRQHPDNQRFLAAAKECFRPE